MAKHDHVEQPHQQRWFRVREIAAMLGTNQSRVIALVHSGAIRAVDISSRPGVGLPRWRITPEALEEFQTARSNLKPNRTARRRKAATSGTYF